MRRQAAAPSAISNRFRTIGLGNAPRAALLALGVCLFLLVPASQAFGLGKVIVNKTGTNAAESVVKSTPPGIDCGSTCQFEFGLLTHVALTAEAAPGAALGSWSGLTCEGGPESNPCEFTAPTISGTITANFVPPPPPPVGHTGGTGKVTFYYAELEGRVNPEGAKVAECFFEYGATTSYGQKTRCAPGAAELGTGTEDVPVGADTDLLQPSTTYHFRLVAKNGGGESLGEDISFTTPAAPADSCPNADRRAEQGSAALVLPDCMALERVSPQTKYGSFAWRPVIGAGDNRVFFSSGAALGDAPNLAVISPYSAERGAAGWLEPDAASAPPPYCCGSSGSGEATMFTPDFAHWVTFPATEAQSTTGAAQIFREGAGGSREALSPLFKVRKGKARNPFQVGAAAGDADLRHVFFEPQGFPGTATLQPNDPLSQGSANLGSVVYEAYLGEDGEPSLALLTRDKNGKVWGGTCGAFPGAADQEQGAQDGSVSPDGLRVFFSTRPGGPETGDCTAAAGGIRILRRVQTPEGFEITDPIVSECDRSAPTCDTSDGDDEFQGASLDGTKLFFTTTRQLANTDLDTPGECKLRNNVGPSPGCDLYLYDYSRPVGERLVQISAGDATAPERGKNAEVLGVSSISGDGTHAYFVARNVLTTGTNPVGATAIAGKPNLYLWQSEESDPAGKISFIGTLSSNSGTSGDSSHWSVPEKSSYHALPVLGTSDPANTAVGGDGHILVFTSHAALTPDDVDGEAQDIYRFDSDAGTLELVSGGDGPFNATSMGLSITKGGAPTFAQENRYASEDGETIIFRTDEALLPGDANDATDLYGWRSGHLFRLPADPSILNASVSQTGEEIAFETFRSLVGQDRDTAKDVYVARVDGGFPGPVEPEPCEGEECRGAGDANPQAPSAASESFSGEGNVQGRPVCVLAGRRAAVLSRRAKRLRRSALRVNRANHRKAVRVQRRAQRYARRARAISKRNKRCRRLGRAGRRVVVHRGAAGKGGKR